MARVQGMSICLVHAQSHLDHALEMQRCCSYYHHKNVADDDTVCKAQREGYVLDGLCLIA